jgi:hypothetical protein
MIQLKYDHDYDTLKILTYGFAVALYLLETYALFQNFYSMLKKMLILWKKLTLRASRVHTNNRIFILKIFIEG